MRNKETLPLDPPPSSPPAAAVVVGAAAAPASTPVAVNQQAIAEQLGISRTTVSRCFTNHPGINPITRARVFDLASRMGYQHMELRAPTKVRPSLKKRVGVLVCTEVEEYFRPDYESPGMSLYAGVSEFAMLRGIRLELHYVSPRDKLMTDPSYQKLKGLLSREWDGVILIYPFPREIVDHVELNFPMVSLVEQYGTSAFNCVDVDHYKGIAQLVDQLTALGHEQIGFYTKPYEVEAQWSLRRFSAYAEMMVRLGQPLHHEDVINVLPKNRLSLEESFDYVRQRVAAGVTAWICAADHQAYDLIAALRERGLEVPGDVSVTGFDGIARPDWAPLLTTTVVPYREIGFSGASRLLEVMKKRFGSPQHILINPQVREGETIGPARL